jgi:hypothetical protein
MPSPPTKPEKRAVQHGQFSTERLFSFGLYRHISTLRHIDIGGEIQEAFPL